MQRSLRETLGQFREQDYTVRLCQTLFSSLPGSPPFVHYSDVAGAVHRLDPAAGPDAVARAEQLAGEEAAGTAVWVADALDKADAGLAIASGLSNLMSLFGGGRKRRTFESDTQQAIDASLKLLGLAYMAHRLFPGAVQEKAARVLALPAGHEAILYTATVEIGLPFTDNLIEGSGNVVSRLVSSTSGGGADRFAQFAGASALGDAKSMLAAMTGPIEQVLAGVRGQIGPLTDKLRSYVPAALGAADSVTGVVATGLDALPAWQFLGSRLAAEACAARALGR
jgi:hypothetical protein